VLVRSSVPACYDALRLGPQYVHSIVGFCVSVCGILVSTRVFRCLLSSRCRPVAAQALEAGGRRGGWPESWAGLDGVAARVRVQCLASWFRIAGRRAARQSEQAALAVRSPIRGDIYRGADFRLRVDVIWPGCGYAGAREFGRRSSGVKTCLLGARRTWWCSSSDVHRTRERHRIHSIVDGLRETASACATFPSAVMWAAKPAPPRGTWHLGRRAPCPVFFIDIIGSTPW